MYYFFLHQNNNICGGRNIYDFKSTFEILEQNYYSTCNKF